MAKYETVDLTQGGERARHHQHLRRRRSAGQRAGLLELSQERDRAAAARICTIPCSRWAIRITPAFCQFGKNCDERLEKLGAKRVHPRVDCDVDYEAPAKSWTEGVFAALSSTPEAAPTASRLPASEASAAALRRRLRKAGRRKNPFPARLLANRLLNGEGSGKEVRHYEISLAGSGLSYEAGDALGVMPANCGALVSESSRRSAATARKR